MVHTLLFLTEFIALSWIFYVENKSGTFKKDLKSHGRPIFNIHKIDSTKIIIDIDQTIRLEEDHL